MEKTDNDDAKNLILRLTIENSRYFSLVDQQQKNGSIDFDEKSKHDKIIENIFRDQAQELDNVKKREEVLKIQLEKTKKNIESSLLQEKQLKKRLKKVNIEVQNLKQEEKIKRNVKQFIDIDCSVINSLCLKEIENDNKISLIYGEVQSGKTNAIFNLLLRMRFYDPNCIIVIVISNYINMQLQYEYRINEFNKKLEKYNNQYNRKLELLEPFVLVDDLKNAAVSCINLLCLQNTSQIKKVIDFLKIQDLESRKVFTIIDEIDTFSSQNNTRFSDIFQLEFLPYSSIVVGITATPADTLFKHSSILRTKYIYELVSPENYYGINDIMFMAIKSIPQKRGDLVFSDRACLRILKRLGKLNYMEKYGHPVHILIKSSQYTDNHNLYFNKIIKQKTIDKKWCVIVFNGKIVKFYCEFFKKDIVINKIGIERKKKGIFTLPKLVSYPDLLEFLSKKQISHIATISGRFADRGYSFISSNYHIHLTHEYLSVSNTATCSYTIQSLRICGVYKTKTPLIVYSTCEIIDDINKSYSLVGKIYKNITENDDAITTVENVVNMIELKNQELPKRKLCKVSYKGQFNIESDGILSKERRDGKIYYICPDDHRIYQLIYNYLVKNDDWHSREDIRKNSSVDLREFTKYENTKTLKYKCDGGIKLKYDISHRKFLYSLNR